MLTGDRFWLIHAHLCKWGCTNKYLINDWETIQQDRMNSDYECLVGTWKCFWVLTQDQYTFLKKKYVNKKNNEWGRAVRGRFDRRISTSLSSSSTNNSFWKRQNIYFLELERGGWSNRTIYIEHSMLYFIKVVVLSWNKKNTDTTYLSPSHGI